MTTILMGRSNGTGDIGQHPRQCCQQQQSSSSAGQPVCTDPTAPTPREQATQQSLSENERNHLSENAKKSEEGPSISAAPPYYGTGFPFPPTLNPRHPEDRFADAVITALSFAPGGAIISPGLRHLQLEHELEHHEISPEDATQARLQIALGVRMPEPGGTSPADVPSAGASANAAKQSLNKPAPAQPANTTPPPAPAAPPAKSAEASALLGYFPNKPGAVNEKGQLALPAGPTPTPTYVPGQPGVVNTTGQLALPADPNALALYNASNKTSDVLVIGRLADTSVLAEVPGHQVLGPVLNATQSRPWTPTKNDAWIQGGIDKSAPFYLATTPTNETLQPVAYGVPGFNKNAPPMSQSNQSALQSCYQFSSLHSYSKLDTISKVIGS
jgi:hypothetical protein